jgi:hypothetical protein
MNPNDQIGEPGYDQDFYAWLVHNARLLREGRLSAVDAAHVAEELEDMGKSQKRALASHLRVLLIHLLKWRYQPDRRGPSWRVSIRTARDRIEAILADSPSLKRLPEELYAQEYAKARKYAADETGLPLATFPEDEPFNLAEALSEDYLPQSDQHWAP